MAKQLSRLVLSIVLPAMMLLASCQSIAAAQTSINYALGKPYTTSVPCYSNYGDDDTVVTDGNKYYSRYITDNGAGSGSPVSLTVDLKSVYTLDEIRVWHYYEDGRTFHNTKTEVSEDGEDWTTVFDSAEEGEYVDREQGKLIVFDPVKVRYIRDWVRGSDEDNESLWSEIQAYGPLQSGEDAKQDLPLKDSMESTDNIEWLYIGTINLTQDRKGGEYAVQVVAGDNTTEDGVYYRLTASGVIDVAEYNQIKLWVKPQAGAKWVEFWTWDFTNEDNCLIKNDKDGDGKFRVGEDLVSGQWNEVTLDLTKTSNPTMANAADLCVRTNDLSTWIYDELTSVYSPVYSLDLSKFVNSKTQLVDGELQFIPVSGTNAYDTYPTVLTSQRQFNFEREDYTQADFQAGTARGVVANENGSLELQKGGNHSFTATTTEDFSGTNSNTQAVNNSVQLASGGIDSYDKLLLHSDGPNGSTTFTDSAAGKTITAYGNAKISTAQSEFGGASGYFDGSGDYLSTQSSSDFEFGGGDYTIDFWINTPATGTRPIVFHSANGTTPINRQYILLGGSNLNYYIYNSGSLVVSLSASSVISANTWQHIAVVRSGSDFNLYVNGVSRATATWSGTLSAIGQPYKIGQSNTDTNYYYLGYIDEFRVSKGIARWTDDFTPPPSPYANYQTSGTYTHMSQDVSSAGVANNFKISYSKTTPEDTSLSVEVRTSLDGGDTWDDWVEVDDGDTIIPNGTNLGNCRVQWRANLATSDPSVTPSLDEVTLSSTDSSSVTITSTADFDGTQSNTQAVDDSEILYGIPDSDTKLLLHCDGANNGTTFTDETGKTVTANGNAVTSTSRFKFGGACGYFDGTGDYLTIADDPDFDFGSGDFTIDFWFYPTSYSGEKYLFIKGSGTSYAPVRITYSSSANTGKINMSMSTSGSSWDVNLNTANTFALNQWHHVAVVRNASTVSVFKNGNLECSGSIAGALMTNSTAPRIGIADTSYYPFAGYIDEFRISKGLARWTDNFTPPAGAYSLFLPTYQLSGTYTHTPQDVSGGGVANNFIINYSETVPDNTSLSMEVRISSDGGDTWSDWAVIDNGDTIIPNGTELDDYSMQWRANLSTSDPSVTPSLDEVTINNGGCRYTSSGTYTSPDLDISADGSASGSRINWDEQDVVVGGTVIGDVMVETSLSTDGGATWDDWQEAASLDPIPGITSSTDLSNARLRYRVTLSTSDETVSPLLDNITLFINIDGNNVPVLLPQGKIKGMVIDSSYVTATGPLNTLPVQRVHLAGVVPTAMALSGDRNFLFYKNPQDANKLYRLDLRDGWNELISSTVPTEIKTNFDGTKVAFKNGSYLYLYDKANESVTSINSSVGDFELQNDGTLFYFRSNTTYRLAPGAAAPGTSCLSSQAVSYLDVAKTGNKAFFSNTTQLFSLNLTPAGWKSASLTTAAKNIDGLWSSPAGDLVFYKNADGWYCYQVSTKSVRKLDLTAANVIRVTDDNKLAVLGVNNEFRLYDPDTDTVTDIRPADASGAVFDVDSSGGRIAYVAAAGLATSHSGGTLQRPERYLLCFNDDGNWYTHKSGRWEIVRAGSIPTAEDLLKSGMTIDQINALTEADFSELYNGGREIYSLDVAIYFASFDPYTTPSLKGIIVMMKGGLSSGDLEETPLANLLYAKKQQDFNAAGWRQIKKIYSVELYPKDAETRYFITSDGETYKSCKNKKWVTVDPSLFEDLEQNWIEITLQGMTATELRSVPESFLSSLLPLDNFSVIYVQKVQDGTTEGYTSQIFIDYTATEFNSANLVLKITMTDGTVKEYPNLTKTEVEDFMSWLSKRQFNKGPIFYKVVTSSATPGVNQVNDYINYYLIQSVIVEEID